MADKLNAKRVAISLAIVTGIVSIACALLIAIVPGFTTSLFGSIFHGIDISVLVVPLTFGIAILGTIEAVVLALLIGWLFVVVYNKIKN